jgi:type I restriction enzyme, S subunit
VSWPTVNLGELVDSAKGSLVSGPFGSNIGSRFFVDEGVPIIRGNNLAKGAERFLDEGFVFLTEQKASEFANCKALPSDIIFTAAGSIGQVGVIPENRKYEYYIISNKQIRARIDLCKALPNFVYLWLSSNQMVRYIESQNNGGAVPLLNLSLIRRLPVPHPPLDKQARIAEILSAYDDLIENNRRRIGLLEEAARLLYREWFVSFRFPGHEHVKITNGLPDGWERRTLKELAISVEYGFTESASHEVDGPRFLRITDIVDGPIDWSTVPRCPIADERMQRFLLSPGDIVVARTGATTGWARRIGRQSEPAVFASYLVRFRFGRNYRPELAATFMESEAYKAFVRANLGGAAQPNASATVLGSAPVPVPIATLQKNFADAVTPMYEQIDALMEQNQKLLEARDLLLPRLMNGEIVV